MGSISLKLPDEILETSGQCARAMNLSRAEYIRRAIDRLNRETQDNIRSERLTRASLKVRQESMRVNAEFASFEGDPYA